MSAILKLTELTFTPIFVTLIFIHCGNMSNDQNYCICTSDWLSLETLFHLSLCSVFTRVSNASVNSLFS